MRPTTASSADDAGAVPMAAVALWDSVSVWDLEIGGERCWISVLN
jgi:hypothetical protein